MLRNLSLALERHIPVGNRIRRRLSALQGQRRRRRKLENALEDGARLRDVTVREILFDRERIDFSRQVGVNEQCLQLRAEDPLSVSQLGVVQRLYAQAVTG